jgi:hypothetical protein
MNPFENSILIFVMYSHSELSQDELIQLQKETHFDKKELQQWYKGRNTSSFEATGTALLILYLQAS